jgi:tellurite methyltransferase
MPHPDAEYWNERYLNEGLERQKKRPNRLLLENAHLLPAAGLVLDAACGVGVNGLYLAGRGLHVIGLDISLAALRLATASARQNRLPFSAAVWNLDSPCLPPDHFDAILNFRYLSRPALIEYRQSLKPGGFLLFETFLAPAPPGSNPTHYLEPGELIACYSGFEILAHKVRQELDRRLESLVARREA